MDLPLLLIWCCLSSGWHHFWVGLELTSPPFSPCLWTGGTHVVHSSHCCQGEPLNLTGLVPGVKHFRVTLMLRFLLTSKARHLGPFLVPLLCSHAPSVKTNNAGERTPLSFVSILRTQRHVWHGGPAHKCLWFCMEMNKTYFCPRVLSATTAQYGEECSQG